MGRFQFLTFLFISALLLSISLPQGYGRRIKVVTRFDAAEKVWSGREMAEMVMDYEEPGANTNPESGVSAPSPP